MIESSGGAKYHSPWTMSASRSDSFVTGSTAQIRLAHVGTAIGHSKQRLASTKKNRDQRSRLLGYRVVLQLATIKMSVIFVAAAAATVSGVDAETHFELLELLVELLAG